MLCCNFRPSSITLELVVGCIITVCSSLTECYHGKDVWAAMIAKLRNQKVFIWSLVSLAARACATVRENLKIRRRLFMDSIVEGLPEYAGPWYKGQFDASGNVPIIDDSRVSFLRDGSTKCSPVISFPHTMCLLSTWTPTFTRLRYTH
jgi:hypothetical protein